ncbi:hypothetical protein WG922_04310 [Ramlibacter sp. AN1015]|uniref:hypothetical protein n=1 Tax=Ramlibacter sp. AN1015 TaxID=3133428 RepID=UPI0030BB7A81
MHHRSIQRRRGRVARHLRRFGVFWLVALALLIASQMLWQWHTWPVRDLMDAVSTGAQP